MAGGGAVSERGDGLSARAILSAVRSARRGGAPGVIVVAGATALAPLLARELRAGGDASAVREGRVESVADCAALVWIGEPDVEALREAARHRVPIVAVTEAPRVPYVFDTDVIAVRPGQGLPVDQIAAALARRLGDRGPSLAAALPVLSEAVVDEQIRSAARRNAVLAAGVLRPGAGMNVLTPNQIRLVMRIGLARGRDSDAARAVGALGGRRRGLRVPGGGAGRSRPGSGRGQDASDSRRVRRHGGRRGSRPARSRSQPLRSVRPGTYSHQNDRR